MERPAGPESAELRRHLLAAVLLWAQRWREAQLEGGGAARTRTSSSPGVPGGARAGLRHEPRGRATTRPSSASPPGRCRALLTRLTGQTHEAARSMDRVILEAARLLRFSDLSIKEIAARLGFGDQFAFSKAFKRQRGEAPLDFRERQPPPERVTLSLISWLARKRPVRVPVGPQGAQDAATCPRRRTPGRPSRPPRSWRSECPRPTGASRRPRRPPPGC